MAGEVEATGKGFLTSTGQIKDKQTLAAEDSKAAKKTKDNSDSNASGEDTSVTSALKSVRSRFTENANSVISVINENDSNLKSAQTNIKAQIETAKELKSAIKDGNDEKADKKRAELADLQKERDQIADKINEDNNSRVADRVKSISFGNKPQAIVKIEPAKLEKTDTNQDLNTAKGVDDLIDSLKEDKDNIKAQRAELKEARQEVKSIVNDVRGSIENIEKASIASLQEADKAAQKIASDIASAGSQATLVSNIDESIVKTLLA